MGSSGRSVGIAGTTKHMNMVIGGGCAIQGIVGSGVTHDLQGEVIEDMGSGVQGLCLVASRERHLKEEVADHVGGGADDAFGLAILGRGVRA
jgi:hypothetical protein